MSKVLEKKRLCLAGLIISCSFPVSGSADSQSSWHQQHTISADLNAIQMVSESTGYVVGSDNYIAALSYFGDTLTVLNVPDSGVAFEDLCFVDSSTGWVTGAGGAVFVTTDKGSTWDYCNQKPGGGKYFTSIMKACCFVDLGGQHVGWVGGSNGELWRTLDGGTLWSLANGLSGGGQITRTINDIDFCGPDMGYCVARGGEIYRTHTLGGEWLPEASHSTEWLSGVSVDCGSGWRVGWIVGRGGTILHSPSVAEGWTDVAPSWLVQAVTGVTVLSNEEVYIVGTQGLVLHTTNAGGSWDSLRLGTESFNDIFGLSEDHIWIVGDNGANYYSRGEVCFVDPLTPQDTLFAGSTYPVRFSTEFSSKVHIRFRSQPGAMWELLAADWPATDGTFPFEVPYINSPDARLTVTSAVPGKDLLDGMTFAVFVEDLDAPVISDPVVSYRPLEGSDVTVSATVEDLHGVSATLWYRQGGSEVYSHTPMAADSADLTSFQGVIEGLDVTIKGLEYYIEAVDSSIYTNHGFHQSDSDPAYVEIYTNNHGFSIPSSQPESEIYSMVSIPLVLANNKISQVLEPEDVLGPYDRTKWRLFRWSPAANQGLGQYLEYGGLLSETTFEPSRAFWLVSSKGGLKTGRGHSVPSADGRIDIEHVGWHQVANPFAYDVPVDSIVLDPLLDGFYHWDPDADQYDRLGPGDVLEPYDGYFIRSDAADLSIIIPAIDASAVGGPVREPRGLLDWKILLHVRSEEAQGSSLLFGQSSHADRNFDRLDLPDIPPPHHRRINSYIPHPDWPTFSGDYRADVRCPDERGLCWDFNIEAHIDGFIDMAFDLDIKIPDEARVVLLDKDTGFPRDLRVDPHIRYLGSGRAGVASFRLIVGPQEFVSEQVDLLLPTRFRLCQNHPNPFRVSTSIRYALPGAGEVALKIYDVRGEEVAVLIDDEPREAGYHVEVWDGRDKCGRKVSTGMYFYQFRVGASRHTRKMLLIK